MGGGGPWSGKEYGVELTPEQRNQLQRFSDSHACRETLTAREIIRARILLKTDEGWTAPQVAEALDVAEGTVFGIIAEASFEDS